MGAKAQAGRRIGFPFLTTDRLFGQIYHFFGRIYQADGHTPTHLRRMPYSDFHAEAVALAQLIARDTDKPPDPTVVSLIEQTLQAAYEDGSLAASMHTPRRGPITFNDGGKVRGILLNRKDQPHPRSDGRDLIAKRQAAEALFTPKPQVSRPSVSAVHEAAHKPRVLPMIPSPAPVLPDEPETPIAPARRQAKFHARNLPVFGHGWSTA